MILIILADQRLVLNIGGEENIPSDQWSPTSSESRSQMLIRGSVDPFYQRTVPVLVWSTQSNNNV